MKKQDDSSCSVFFMLGFLGFIAFLVYKMIRFFISPAGLHGLLELLKGLGLCLGFVVLIILAVGVYFRFAPAPKNAKLSKMSKDYAIRINSIEMVKTANAESTDELPDSINSNFTTPVYLLFTLTNYGLQLAPLRGNLTWEGIPSDNADRYRIFSMDRPGAIIFPTGFMFLDYILYRWENNVKITNTPIDQSGDYGALPLNLGNDFVEIVITNTHIVDIKDLQIYIPRQRTLRLKLIALDHNGNEDRAITRELYEALYNHMHPPDTSYEDYYGY